MFADNILALVGSREKLQNLVRFFGGGVIRKLKENAAKSKVISCSQFGGQGGADIVLNGKRLKHMAVLIVGCGF